MVSGIAAFATLVVVVLFVLLPGPGTLPLVDPDEGRHAEIARELFAESTWRERVVLRLGGEPYRDKPVLYYWSAAVAYALLGITPAAARLPSVAAALGTVVAVGIASSRYLGFGAGLAAGAVLATAPGTAVLGRAATLDMLFTFWITLGMLLGWRWLRSGSGASLIGAAIAAGFGTLTKGLAAPALVVLAVALSLAVERRWDRLRPLPLGFAALAYGATVVPWAAAAWTADPDYLRELLLTHHLTRFLGGGPGRLHAQSAAVYVPALLLGFFPWILLLPAAWRARPRREDPAAFLRFAALWAGVVVAFFSVSRGKLPTYVFPAFPALAILIGAGLERLLRSDTAATGRGGDPSDRAAGTTLLGLGLVLIGTFLILLPVVLAPIARERYEGVLAPAAGRSTILAAVGVVVLGLTIRGQRRAAIAVCGAMAATAPLAAATVASPVVGELTGTAHLAHAISARAPDAPVVVYGLALPSLPFNLGRPVTRLDRPRALARFVRDHPTTVVATSPRHAATVIRATGFAVWLAGPRRVLLGPPGPAGPTTLGSRTGEG